MKSLAERHQDRAQRIADNETEFTGGTTGSIGTVTGLYRDMVAAYNRLDDKEKAQFDDTRENLDMELEGERSLAEAPDGSGRSMAGIGVVNTKVVPAAVFAAEQGNGGGTEAGGWTGETAPGWGETPPATVDGLPAPSFDPARGNIAGQSLADQGAVDVEAAEKASKASIKAAEKAAANGQ